jgi:2-polyprenyl-6-methoxyphenol hydroxylase-like FAD-dependent oxidoreductase
MGNSLTTGRGRAVVIGGSIAGLLAARVLSERFQDVTIVERDSLARNADPRKAIPQGRHAHVLLHKGIQIIDQLFPDLLPALLEAGLVMADMGQDFRWRHFGVWKTQFPSDIRVLFVNRPLFEWQIAARLLARPNVSIIEHCDVTGLIASPGRERVTGVTLRQQNTGEQDLAADLVVDASGRGSHLPQWLRALALDSAQETRVEVNLGYASRLYRRPAALPQWTSLFVIPRPPATRGAAIFPIDGNRWMVTLAGWLADHPSGQDNEYLEFAGSLEVPEVRQSLERAEPLTSIVVHKFPSNLRRHYESLATMPECLIVLGDAMCSFNPVYGQGMTVAALEAMALARWLVTGGASSRKFHRTASKLVDIAWQLAVGEDLRYPDVKGVRPNGTAFLHWYIGLVHQATSRDQHVAQRFYEVIHLIEPPPKLFNPGVLRRTAACAFRH